MNPKRLLRVATRRFPPLPIGLLFLLTVLLRGGSAVDPARPVRLRGKIVEATTGLRIREATILVHATGPRASNRILKTQSDVDGAFSLPLPDPGWWMVDVAKEGYEGITRRVLVNGSNGPTSFARFQLIPSSIAGRPENADLPATLSGRLLVDPELERPRPLRVRLLEAVPLPPPLSFSRGQTIRTLPVAEKSFSFDGLAPGNYFLEATVRGARVTTGGIYTLVSGQEVHDAVIVLSARHLVCGRVADPNGRPIAAARIRARSHGTLPTLVLETRSDEAGCFLLGVHQAASLKLRVDHPAFHPMERLIHTAENLEGPGPVRVFLELTAVSPGASGPTTPASPPRESE